MGEKTKILSEHIQTRISHTQPQQVLCVVAFCDMTKAITRLPHQSPSISIPVVWFVQSSQCTEYMMCNWLQEAWDPLHGGLANSPQFLDFSQRALPCSQPGILVALSRHIRRAGTEQPGTRGCEDRPPAFAETGLRDAQRGTGSEESSESSAHSVANGASPGR